MNVSIGGIAKTVEITSFDKLGDVKVCMLTTTADGSIGFEQLSDEVRDTIYASFPVDTANGDIASFEDGADNVPVRDMKVNVEPYQNLNGYDSPWVGGAGKNKVDVRNPSSVSTAITKTNSENGSTVTITANNASYAYAYARYDISSLIGATIYVNFTKTASPSGLGYVQIRCVVNGSTQYIEIGSSASPTTGKTIPADATSATLYLILKNASGDGSVGDYATFNNFILSTTSNPTWTPYENICPIYPANGKNLLENTGTSKDENGITWTVNDDMSISAKGTATANSLFVVNTIDLESDKSYVLTGCPVGGESATKWQIQVLVSLNSGATATDKGEGVTLSNLSGTYYIRCVVRSGNTVDFVFKPMIRPVEITDSTYVPYNAIGITRTGANLWDEQWETGTISGSTGANASDSTRIRSKNYIHVVPNGIYYIHVNYSSSFDGTIQLVGYGKNKEFIGTLGWYGNPGHVLFTASSDVYYIRFIGTTARGASYTQNDISINSPSSASQYEPYTADRYYIESSTPIYGGTLEVETGLLTVNKGYKSFNGSENWQRTTGSSGVYRYSANGSLTGSKRPTSNSTNANLLSNMYESKTANQTYTGVQGISQQANNDDMHIYDSTYNALTLDDWKAHLASNNLQVIYELATPLVYQLTPTQVKTLLGYNNIWTDSGTVEVQYRANIGLYIQKIIGATEDDMVANQNISANKYFFVGEELYYSTSAISAGQTIIVGTNCIKTNLADALNALNT